MNPLTKVRDKFLLEAGIVADKNHPRYNEQLVNTATLTPICAIDLAYGMYQKLDKTYFRQDCKRWYNEMQTKFHAIFAPKTGILYRGLTDDEILAACDAERVEIQRVFEDFTECAVVIGGILLCAICCTD